MIGVVVPKDRHETVEEFFELFKTPWEYAQPSKHYPVLLVEDADPTPYRFDALIHYGASAQDCAQGDQGAWIKWDGRAVPIYCGLRSPRPTPNTLPVLRAGTSVVGTLQEQTGSSSCRIGYRLFREVEFLLKTGQPAGNALIPTLDLHISMLRTLMLKLGVPVVEVPPLPLDFEFACCLTHDVDFFQLRRHRFDSTMWGFLYRAVVASFWSGLRGTRPWADVWANLHAAARLPAVLAGWRPDPWQPFRDYLALESPHPSTFFVIPHKGDPGKSPGVVTSPLRATRYEVADATDEVRAVTQAGGEIALHGINAWSDAESANQESGAIEQVTGARPRGVRMHWLYFDSSSPAALQDAGFEYDSTLGYNDAVGFRTGTAQVHRLPPTDRLLELPLQIQDTALFYPDRMGLDEARAAKLCRQVIEHASAGGGVVTINWHGRSLAPERLWGRFYRKLLANLRSHSVWFATGEQVVDWFSARRAIRFSRDGASEQLEVSGTAALKPSARIRVYQPSRDWKQRPWMEREFEFEDTEFQGGVLKIAVSAASAGDALYSSSIS